MQSEIGVKLTGDNSEYRSMLSNSVDEGVSWAGKLTEKTADKLFGLRDVSHVVANALGLNLENIAEKLARWYTGLNKEEEEAYKRSADLSTQQADLAIKNMRVRLSDEQRYQLALHERDSLIEQLGKAEIKTGKDQEEVEQKRIDLENKIAEIQAFEAKQEAERSKAFESDVKSRFAAGEAAQKQQRDALSLTDREAVLKDDIAGLTERINSGTLKGVELENAKTALSTRELELQQTTTREHDAHVKLLERKQELTFAALPLEEKIASYQDSIATLEKLIAEAKKNHVDHDEEDVALLESQAELQKLIAQQEKQRVPVQKQISAEIQNQLDQMNSLETHLSSLIGAVRGGSDFASASDAVLGEIARRDRETMRKAQADPQFGSAFSGLAPTLDYAHASADLYAVNQELQLRATLRGVDYQTALKNYAGDPLHFDQLYNSANQTNDALSQISNQLANSGLFPKNGPIG